MQLDDRGQIYLKQVVAAPRLESNLWNLRKSTMYVDNVKTWSWEGHMINK